MVTIIHGSFGLLYIIAGKSKALFGSCPLRLSSKQNEEHTKKNRRHKTNYVYDKKTVRGSGGRAKENFT